MHLAKDLQRLLISHFAKVENSVKIAAVRKNEGGGGGGVQYSVQGGGEGGVDCLVQGGGGGTTEDPPLYLLYPSCNVI